MPSIGLNVKDFIAQLEADGVDKVRRDLDAGLYNERVGEKGTIARGWLRDKDRDLAATATARNDHLRTRSTEAAERQATAAEKATRIAWLALVVSTVAAFLSIIAMVRD